MNHQHGLPDLGQEDSIAHRAIVIPISGFEARLDDLQILVPVQCAVGPLLDQSKSTLKNNSAILQIHRGVDPFIMPLGQLNRETQDRAWMVVTVMN
jgi:hypothetical protein